MDPQLKFFSAWATETYLFGLDGSGRIWRAEHEDPEYIEWELIPSPKQEVEKKAS